MNGAFMCGMTLVLIPRFNEVEALQSIENYKATLFEGAPIMYMYLLKSPDLEKFEVGIRFTQVATTCSMATPELDPRDHNM